MLSCVSFQHLWTSAEALVNSWHPRTLHSGTSGFLEPQQMVIDEKMYNNAIWARKHQYWLHWKYFSFRERFRSCAFSSCFTLLVSYINVFYLPMGRKFHVNYLFCGYSSDTSVFMKNVIFMLVGLQAICRAGHKIEW